MKKFLIASLLSFPLSIAAEQTTVEQQIIKPAIAYNYPTNTTWEDKDVADEFYKNPYQVSIFSAEHGEDKQRLWSQTKSMFGYGVGVAGFIWLLPEDVSNWEKNGEMFSKWGKNVTNGPVWDRDAMWINYIGHPYFGGVYYQAARKSGYRQWDSFVYSFLMSTFYWEYGIEAFAEVPAIQDLVVTPVLGWAVGEWAYLTENSIRKNGGLVWGSEFWGDVSLALLDPVDSLGRGINSIFEREIVTAGTGYLNLTQVPTADGNLEDQIELKVSYKLGSGKQYYPEYLASDYTKQTNDPIDTSIIGMTFGSGFITPDKNWALDNGLFVEASLGLYFSRSFSTRLSYARGKLHSQIADESLAYENYSVSGQYYFNSDANLRPYVSLGFGEMMRDQDRSRKTFVSHGALGLHYKISNKLALQADIKQYIGTRYNNKDNTAAVNIVYRFNKGEWR